MTESDNDPRQLEIMEGWVRRIVAEVAEKVADGIMVEVGRIFLEAKTSNAEMARINRLRFEVLEASIANLRAQVRERP